tara:strand:+ start:574 stop:753 length:180 start_codon:yes stop_codon:yes gene_type:complete
MKVRVTYTYELSEDDYKIFKQAKKQGKIDGNVRDFIWSCFVQAGEYATNQELWNLKSKY